MFFGHVTFQYLETVVKMTRKSKVQRDLISLYVLQRNVEAWDTPLFVLAMFRKFFDFEKVAKIN
jgi:hypothetical protein